MANWRDYVNGYTGAEAGGVARDAFRRTMTKRAQTRGSMAVGFVGTVVGSGLGALIGRQIAINRRKNATRGMVLGQLIGGMGGAAISSYGPLLLT